MVEEQDLTNLLGLPESVEEFGQRFEKFVREHAGTNTSEADAKQAFEELSLTAGYIPAVERMFGEALTKFMEGKEKSDQKICEERLIFGNGRI